MNISMVFYAVGCTLIFWVLCEELQISYCEDTVSEDFKKFILSFNDSAKILDEEGNTDDSNSISNVEPDNSEIDWFLIRKFKLQSSQKKNMVDVEDLRKVAKESLTHQKRSEKLGSKLTENKIVLAKKDTALAQKDIVLEQKNAELLRKDVTISFERALRLSFQCIIDLAEVAEDLFKCYPEWAGHRPKKQYDKIYFERLFLNAENDRIVQIKAFLTKHKVTEDEFASVLSDFLKNIRNEEAHSKINPKDRKEAFEHFANFTLQTDEEKTAIQATVIVLYMFGSSNSSELVKNPQLVEDVRRNIIDQRQSYRLMRIPELSQLTDEMNLQKYFDNFAEEKEWEKPVSVVILGEQKKEAWILFNSFEIAHKFWENKDDQNLKISDLERENITLMDIHFNSKITDPYHIQIQLNSNREDDELEKTIISEIASSVLKYEPSNVSKSKQPYAFYIKFRNLDLTMRAYQTLKTNIRESSALENKITVMMSNKKIPKGIIIPITPVTSTKPQQ